jgi:L-threonylcarbamoyladenylate synthase
MAAEIGVLDPVAETLARAFWPGPLTLVVPVRAGAVSELVTAGLPSVALRVPDHPVAQAVIAAAGRPLAAPSANPSGRISPTTARHVLDGLAGRIDAVIDGGPSTVGVESTIVATGAVPRLLRPGGLAQEEIEAVLGFALQGAEEMGDRPVAPGQLASHYAPEAAVRLNATARAPGEHYLGFGGSAGADLDLSERGDLAEAAANLFGHLHRLDRLGGPIAVAPVPEIGLGRAINDRLRRAAAPRAPG